MSLQAGQIVRISDALYRVDFVNASRARVIPLTRRRVNTENDDLEIRGFSISPNSCVEVVTNPERALDEIEMAVAEKELRAAQREAERLARMANAPKIEPKKRSSAQGSGWHIGPTPHPPFRAGTLADVVMKRIVAEPGLDTKTLVATIQTDGNVASCVSRFFQAGYIHKE